MSETGEQIWGRLQKKLNAKAPAQPKPMSSKSLKKQLETKQERLTRVKKETALGYRGNTKRKWVKARDAFIDAQPTNDDGFYLCSKANGHGCGRWLARNQVEVDHVIKRSLRPDLVYEPSNFQILCHPCHQAKDGGMSVPYKAA